MRLILASRQRLRLRRQQKQPCTIPSYQQFFTTAAYIPCFIDTDEDATKLSSTSLCVANKHCEVEDVKLKDLEEEIERLNNGNPINVNSPKQVSQALFGKQQSTSKTILAQAAKGQLLDESGKPLTVEQQRLAALVLECREYRYRNSYYSEAEEDLTVEGTNGDKVLQNEISNTGEQIVSTETVSKPQHFNANDASQYEILVDALYEHDKNQIHNYWKDALKQVTRPSARALVAQLDPTGCPMGYNPLAVPHDPLRGTMVSTNDDATTATTTTTAGKKGSFLRFCRDAKEKHPDCIILTRCGDFYETFGVDAIMLVEHCGLNAMAGKAKAGFPFRAIQASLDCLTQKGFRCAVYEEAADTDASVGAGAKAGPKSRLKTRMLAQIISPASPTYMYDLVLLGNTADTLATAIPARPYMGVIALASGYTLVEISIEERSVRVSERLTAEAMACRLAAYPPASPLILVPPATEYQSHSKDTARMAPFLPSSSQSESGTRLAVKVIPPHLVPEPQAGVDDIERARTTIVSALLKMTEFDEGEIEETNDAIISRRRASIDDFTLVASFNNPTVSSIATSLTYPELLKTQTHPLHVETATQLGLMKDNTIPNLMTYLLPDTAPAATRRFLRRYLLTPPPAAVCEAMSTLVAFLKEDKNSPAVPPLAVPPLGKVLSLLRAGQASAQVYGELLQAMAATVMVLEIESIGDCETKLIDPLMTILEHESGLSAEPRSLKARCLQAISLIEQVVSPLHHAAFNFDQVAREDSISDFGLLIPSGFLERNEAMWRGRVQRSVAKETYDRVETAAEELAEAVAADFFGMSAEDRKADEPTKYAKNPIVQDIFNNMFAIKEIPNWVEASAKDSYNHPRDRNGKILRNRYTTNRVQSAMSEYVAACDAACRSVTAVLTQLSQDLYDNGHIPAIVQASHSNLILSTAFHHAIKANTLGWNCATVYEAHDIREAQRDSAGFLNSVWPYWMDRSQAVPNTFDMKDLFLLTAPNMSGKSTLMRSSAAAALLAVCGLCAPLNTGSKIRRFDHIFVRGASADVPAEHKSAFGAEMGDIAALLRCCGSKSLVFVDELGRGTSPRDGTRLAGAVLEAMAKAGMSGFFATHLHDILNLPLESSERIVKKKMAIYDEEYREGDIVFDDDGVVLASDTLGRHHYQWTYRLTDGICTDSMALVTAAQFGLPEEVLARAEALSPVVASETVVDSNDNAVAVNGFGKNNGEESNPHPMNAVIQLVVDNSGQVPFSVPAGWNPPASLEGQSCVYVLQLHSENGLRYYYVGETDSFQQRLKQHRSKGGFWPSADAIVVPIADGRTEARAMESKLIQKMAQAGFLLQSIHDGRSTRASRRTIS